MPLGRLIETPDEWRCSDWTLMGTNFFGDELLQEEVINFFFQHEKLENGMLCC